MGIAGFIIGTIAGQICGADVYRRIISRATSDRSLQAAIGSGLATAACSSVVYIVLGVHDWLGGADSSWGVSVFLGICMGICQAVLLRDRPHIWRRNPRA
jgi:hypothetical protein